MNPADFAAALADYEALLTRVEAALDSGDWAAFQESPGDLPPVEGDLDPALEERLSAAIARGAALRERVRREAARVAGELAEAPRRQAAHRRYVES